MKLLKLLRRQQLNIWSICVLHGSALTWTMWGRQWVYLTYYIFLSSWLPVCQKLL